MPDNDTDSRDEAQPSNESLDRALDAIEVKFRDLWKAAGRPNGKQAKLTLMRSAGVCLLAERYDSVAYELADIMGVDLAEGSGDVLDLLAELRLRADGGPR